MKPIYQQLMEAIKDDILLLEPNTSILSERDLAQKFGASRMTVRKAIDELVKEGYLYRKHNSGTFVSDPALRIKHSPIALLNTSKSSESIRVLYYDIKSEDPRIAEKLHIRPMDSFIRIVRLNFEEEVPISIDEIHIVKSLYSLDTHHMDDLFNFTDGNEGGPIQQRFLADIVPIKYAQLLNLKINAPVMKVESTIFLQSGERLAFITSYINHDVKNISFVI